MSKRLEEIDDVTTMPTRRRNRSLVESADKRGVAARSPTLPAVTSAKSTFSFRYSFTELSAHGGDASLRHREARLENGKLTSESFEGSIDRTVYEQLVGRVHEQVLHQTQMMLRSLFWFLPAARTGRRDED
jgi:hypothetical protein